MSEKHDFSKALIMWYLIHKRDLPWRKSHDPFRIWLSEIILQQTRISQGTAYYEKFIAEFDDIRALANADETRVLKLWQGLGYYSRARNLHFTAKQVANEMNGRFPETFEGLLKLKGVGDYTASAIASIAYNLPHATVDGNVYRVMSRFFGITSPIDSSKGSKEFKSLAQELLDKDQPGTHNQAVMELGALICTPKKPACQECPLKNNCFAFLQGRMQEFPVKQGKIVTRKRHFNYLVLNSANSFTKIRQRQGKDIWKHLFEFPFLETEETELKSEAIESLVREELNLYTKYELNKFNTTPVIHKLSHQELHANFWIVETDEILDGSTSWDELQNHALPVLLQNFVDKYRGGL